MRLFAISVLWSFVLALGLLGLFSNQPGLMGLCLFAWTPIAILFGYLLRGSGLRVSFGADRVVERIEPTHKESLLKQRERKIT